MDTKSAIKILKNNGFYVSKLEDGNYIVELPEFVYTPRELINLARCYTSEGARNQVKKNVKHFDKRRNRQKTNQAISHEDFDKFPKGKIYKEDIWSWD